MASPSDLSLDYKPNNYPIIQKPVGEHPNQTQKIQEFLARLEEERLKIEAFKRELPLCLQLLNNAVEAYRQQLEAYQTSQGPRPVLEEFIPVKQMSVDGLETPNGPSSEKASWMISAQLWSNPAESKPQQAPKGGGDVSPKLGLLDAKQRNGGGGAFLPFSKEKAKGGGGVTPRGLPELALASADKGEEEKKGGVAVMENGGFGGRRENGGKGVGTEQAKGGNVAEGAAAAAAVAPPPQTHRKARRCWSPDLHRRFVNALQMLGGSQVATPKQIRELMKVDGLTNDEVKSHLQKYRLHTRRPIPAPPASAAAAPQLVVLGGIWVPPEYATTAAGPAIYGAHPGPAHYCTAPVPQDFYPTATGVAPLPHHQIHPALHRSAATATVSAVPTAYRGHRGSPESDMRSGGEQSMESIEDEEEEEEEEGGEQRAAEEEGDEGVAVEEAMKAGEGDGGDDVALKF
ncbi:myb family transcription factor EFM [Ananas comosus]|uniref:Myb family transcription factor EFM n=1 Tax=Ananas comosus TaxID=4615 RepID=A0A199VKQ5_ANACO|nr:myb family transcription factor EFM [Ananas comosus]OAY77588.1 putative transcription factor GLK1 [Ananas comosus]